MHESLVAAAPVVGMVHLPPLPGSPEYDAAAGRDALFARVRRDAAALAAGGVDGLVVENFGDAPFYPESVPKHVVAAMTALVSDVVDETDLPVGVNVLRNDAAAAVSVAAAAGAEFVRVNVHTGARVTDQGVVEGRAHETLRLRDRIDADVAVLADVAVKHSAPLGRDRPLDSHVSEAVTRGLADGVVVSGAGTGEAVPFDRVEAAAERCRELGTPLFVGSGVTPDTVREYLDAADGVVVGTALKEGGVTTNPVEESLVRALVAAAEG